ncbi:hypothetical protein F4860DRAFT_509538 [Xylaria cubensis]|nr:hypothetical protein F4860DRAFT_509538 [Xylaria cubensis]
MSQSKDDKGHSHDDHHEQCSPSTNKKLIVFAPHHHDQAYIQDQCAATGGELVFIAALPDETESSYVERVKSQSQPGVYAYLLDRRGVVWDTFPQSAEFQCIWLRPGSVERAREQEESVRQNAATSEDDVDFWQTVTGLNFDQRIRQATRRVEEELGYRVVDYTQGQNLLQVLRDSEGDTEEDSEEDSEEESEEEISPDITSLLTSWQHNRVHR